MCCSDSAFAPDPCSPGGLGSAARERSGADASTSRACEGFHFEWSTSLQVTRFALACLRAYERAHRQAVSALPRAFPGGLHRGVWPGPPCTTLTLPERRARARGSPWKLGVAGCGCPQRTGAWACVASGTQVCTLAPAASPTDPSDPVRGVAGRCSWPRRGRLASSASPVSRPADARSGAPRAAPSARPQSTGVR